jgi:lysozyme
MESLQQQVVATARAEIGKDYQWGGEDNPGFDCSGLCQWAYAQIGVSIPRTSQEQAVGGMPVAYSDLQLGDLIIIYPDASHVVMYSGNGMCIDASTFGVPVAEVPLSQAGPYNQARRFLTGELVTSPSTTLYGVDVSNNNWVSVSAAQTFIASLPAQGYSWVEAKVSEGDYYTDPYWPATLAACQTANIPVVGYHYAIAADPPAAQVQTFVGNNGGNTVMIDFEANSGDINDFWALVNAFNAGGVQVVLSYLPQWYWSEIGSPDLTNVPGLISSSYFQSGTFGSVEYNDAGGDSGPGWNAYGGATPVIWQFTDGDIVDGFSVDGNAFKGTQDQLQTLLTGAPVTQPPASPTTNPPAIPMPANQMDQVVNVWGQLLTRWDFLGGNTPVEALGAIGAALKIPGYSNPLGDNA